MTAKKLTEVQKEWNKKVSEKSKLEKKSKDICDCEGKFEECILCGEKYCVACNGLHECKDNQTEEKEKEE